MKNIILPVGALLLFALVTCAIIFVEFLTAEIINNSTKVVENVTCAGKAIGVDKSTGQNFVTLKLDCDGKEASAREPEIIANYVRNPDPLTCTIYKSGRAICEFHDNK